MNALRDVRRVRTACEVEPWLYSDHESPAVVALKHLGRGVPGLAYPDVGVSKDNRPHRFLDLER